MATIEIRKKTSKVWQHVSSDFGTYIVSKMYCKTDGNIFKVTEHGGAKRGEYNISDITIYDDTVSGGAETFATPLLLMKRLEALSYVGFYYDGDVIPADLISTDASNTLILGSDGKLYSAGGGAVAFSSITGDPYDNTNLTNALNAKENSLGFTPENVSNKSTNVETDQSSNTKYPSVKSVYDWAVGKYQNILVSGVNIRPVNGESLLGSTNLVVSGLRKQTCKC